MKKMIDIVNAILARLKLGASRHAQQGYVMISLALIGLTGGVVMAVPMLEHASTGLRAARTSAVGQYGARSAAEQALWRLRNDPTVHTGMTGTPPTITYTLPIDGEDATVKITALSDTPEGNGITVYLTVDQDVYVPNESANATFTVHIKNDGIVAQTINRVSMSPITWNPSYVNGSTTGITTDDPDYCYFLIGCRWSISPGVEVPPFGGEVTMSATFNASEGWGAYWMGALVRFDDIGVVYAKDVDIRFMEVGTLQMETTVQPSEVRAGKPTTFKYTVTMTNTGTDPETLQWVKHYQPDEFTYVLGSAAGITTDDPSVSWSLLHNRDKYEWDFPSGLTLEPDTPVTLSFDVVGTLDPGIYTVLDEMNIDGDSGLAAYGILASMSTGETAPVRAVRGYDITATYKGQTVNVEALVAATGIDVVSWVE